MSVKYRGITFPGYNKPIKSNRAGKKKMVLAKKGETIRLIHFGATGYGHNYSCLLYTSPSPRDLSTSRMPSSA